MPPHLSKMKDAITRRVQPCVGEEDWLVLLCNRLVEVEPTSQ